jgi:hypothetical protein
VTAPDEPNEVVATSAFDRLSVTDVTYEVMSVFAVPKVTATFVRTCFAIFVTPAFRHSKIYY